MQGSKKVGSGHHANKRETSWRSQKCSALAGDAEPADVVDEALP